MEKTKSSHAYLIYSYILCLFLVFLIYLWLAAEHKHISSLTGCGEQQRASLESCTHAKHDIWKPTAVEPAQCDRCEWKCTYKTERGV